MEDLIGVEDKMSGWSFVRGRVCLFWVIYTRSEKVGRGRYTPWAAGGRTVACFGAVLGACVVAAHSLQEKTNKHFAQTYT